MGAPSGSKNCTILTDRLDFLASQFERPVYDTSRIEVDVPDSVPNELRAEKKLKAHELQEFRSETSGVRTDRRLDFLEKKKPGPAAPLPAGPAPEGRKKLPGFVLKRKESAASIEEAEEGEEKRPRTDRGEEEGEGGGAAGDAAGHSGPPREGSAAAGDSRGNGLQETAAPQGSPLGLGLCAYSSDEE
mmetsp:Transcript_76691/g.216896  ORF Transcript_76691/g.216896 Transcript_76691/m.216896 type:complete len:188 (+) Transcript_76691:30-593(+)